MTASRKLFAWTALAVCLLATQPSRAGDSPTAAAVPGATVAATAARAEASGNTSRLIFELSAPVEPEAFVMANPDRLIVDLPEIDFRLDPATGRRQPPAARRPGDRKPAPPLAGQVGSFRFGLFAPGKSRIVVDLASPARIVRAQSESAGPGGGARLVIELAGVDRAAFNQLARKRPASEPLVEPAKAAAASPSAPVVVIDPGHGGIDAGAHAAGGVQEKDVVFEFSRVLMEKLKARGRYQIVMTRGGDVFVPLAERVRLARAAGAALFVSIHADTLGDEPGVAGATVYTGADRASDAQAARVAEKENLSDAAAGMEGLDDRNDVTDILFDLTRRETRVFSNAFAKTLVGYFREVSRLNKNPQRSAGFRVLKAHDVPSVLLELGYLSNEKDLANLVDPDWRDRAAARVERAIGEFFNVPAEPARGESESPTLRRSLVEDGHVAARQR